MGAKASVKPPRVVLDTNCVVSALLFTGGRLAWLRRGWQQRDFIPLVSRDTAGELIRVLNYPKFRLSESAQETLLADYLPYTETVNIKPGRYPTPELADPDDMMFVVLAISGKADALVSGDGQLLKIKRIGKGIPVLSVERFAGWLEDC